MSEQKKYDVFQAISDPTRRTLLKLLIEKEMSIVEIAKQFPISRTAVNKHLHILYNAGMVKSRKVGRETRYTLEPNPLAEIQDFLAFFEPYWDDQLAALKQLVEEDSN
ncbi:metalloregulator ArsR/SmtB family transcription factor [Sporosarcina aquimarina]|uniref:ArsR/SmtB family transcription factor n=1 Tax=Sporosarcina aquimarina TaxID=114975 RepID=UPI002040EAB4|nr:metalloregulator ArsR/SmtB family transcription factor [Sporosarcina aquimarina]MCM3758212.1 metalloregulator ArsR/SmtB family transcription factor [Sporosarcina aquimarina]